MLKVCNFFNCTCANTLKILLIIEICTTLITCEPIKWDQNRTGTYKVRSWQMFHLYVRPVKMPTHFNFGWCDIELSEHALKQLYELQWQEFFFILGKIFLFAILFRMFLGPGLLAIVCWCYWATWTRTFNLPHVSPRVPGRASFLTSKRYLGSYLQCCPKM